MTITREADYAMRITALLAQTNTLMDAKTIALESDVPYRFTLKILRKLVGADIAKSYRGINGGYALAKLAEEITLREIIEAIDGPIAINRCMVEPGLCPNTGACKLQKQLLKAQSIFADALAEKSLQEILDN